MPKRCKENLKGTARQSRGLNSEDLRQVDLVDLGDMTEGRRYREYLEEEAARRCEADPRHGPGEESAVRR